MASEKVMIGMVIFFMTSASCQYLGTKPSDHPAGICHSAHCNTINSFYKLQGCVVVLGNLSVVLMEKTNTTHFINMSFPNLREVTGFVVVYRVRGLESIGQLFPNLTRIRGSHLVNNYGLVVHDMRNLRDVGLYSLLKIDRGGVFISGGRRTCYVDTVDWTAIAPNTRHTLTYPEMKGYCHTSAPCKCGGRNDNYCWNSKRCQRFASGPKAQSCHPECFGCGEDPDNCSLCRHFTHQGRCVSQCPSQTLLLPENQYCITEEECQTLSGWAWKGACVFRCPLDYHRVEVNETSTCEPCFNCKRVCKSLLIDSLSKIQQAERCVYITGYLKIELGSIPRVLDEMKQYLGLIETVTDYVYIDSSDAITSLDFLPSLRHIVGKTLINDTYSVIIHDMKNLKQLFTQTAMEEIQVDRGKLKVLNNPLLCMSRIKEFEAKFPVPSNETEIPPGMNGYSGGCEDSVELHVQILNQTAANVLFLPKKDRNIHYTVLYAKVPFEIHTKFVPEGCAESQWFAIHSNDGKVMLSSLRPASTYAVCIETFVYSKNPAQSYLARTSIVKFTTPFEKPEPPVIQELVSFSANSVRLRWVNHRDYRQHITSYELDVILIEYSLENAALRDHCNIDYIFEDTEDFSRHVLVLKPPIEYESCESNCNMLINPSEGLYLTEDYFDICSSFKSECNVHDEARPKNSTYKSYVKTLSLDIDAPRNQFQVEGLSPFTDYRFRLRACAGKKCSRSTREVIRTLKSNKADIPYITQSLNDKENIYIKWKPPDETNGPILTYTVHVIPSKASNESSPYVWCVDPEVRSLVVRLQATNDSQVRVCSSTLGSYSACSEWQRIPIFEVDHSAVGAGIIFSIVLATVSIITGFVYYRRRRFVDSIPLVDMTSMYRSESDPPVVLMTDFMPLYSVPSNEALL